MTLKDTAFKKWDGQRFTGKFLMSVYEVVSVGVSKNLSRIRGMEVSKRNAYLQEKAKELWTDPVFIRNSGAGVRGTTRLTNLLPLAENFFAE